MSAATELWTTEDYPVLLTSTSIRVIAIKREAGPVWLSCSMWVVDLEDSPVYNCLSYTWGDPKQQNDEPQPEYQILCNHKLIPITQNLYHALDTLSTVAENYTSTIWADAICIDQLNLQERAQQVRMMDRVYQSAGTVVAWLGPADEDTKAAFQVIETLARAYGRRQYSSDTQDPYGSFRGVSSSFNNKAVYTQLGIPIITGHEWSSYIHLLERSWFQRAWTFQESYLARRLTFYCGAHCMYWETLRAHHDTLVNLSWLESRLATATNIDTNLDMPVAVPSSGYYMARDQIHIIKNHMAADAYEKEKGRSRPAISTSGSIRKFQDQIGASCRGRQASDARDMIFSKLGSSQFDSIVPDYTKSVKRTFIDITRSVQEESDSFGLEYVEDHALRKNTELPSWVPDYTTMLLPRPFSSTGGPYHASGGLPKVVLPHIHPDAIGVLGIEVGHITQVASTYKDLMRGESLLEYLNIVKGLDAIYHNGQDRVEAFWRTLLGNRTGRSPEKPNHRWISSFREMMTMMAIHVCKKPAISEVGKKCMARALADGSSILEALSNHEHSIKDLCNTISTLAEADTTGAFPTCAQVDHRWQEHYSAIQGAVDLEAMLSIFEEAYSYFRGIGVFLPWRRFFRTQTCYIGIGAESLQVGDSIFLIQGSGEPWILRAKDDEEGGYRFVGIAYVHGVMEGELVESLQDKLHSVEIR